MSSDENIVARIWRYIGAFQHGILRIFGIFVILFLLIVFIGGLLSNDEFELADSGVLIFAPEGPVVEEPTTISPNDAFTASLLDLPPGGDRPNGTLHGVPAGSVSVILLFLLECCCE